MSEPEQFGAYLVYEQLGVGGMATVHRAERVGVAGFRKPIALKRMLPGLAQDGEFVQSFVREARLASNLRHANIAQVFDFGKVDDTYFIAMELVRGPTLKQITQQCNQAAGAIPIAVTVAILEQVCAALDYAHTLSDDRSRPLGIVHRDVTPSNVIVSSSGTVKLIDFGLAKVRAFDPRTKAGTVKGKMGYMAPEYTLGAPIDARADLFALGVVTHELLTGRQLFGTLNDLETLQRLREMPIQPPSRWNPQVIPELDHIVMTAVHRDPELRWQNAAAFRAAVLGFIREYGLTVTSTQIMDWVVWAFEQQPREDDSDLARVVAELSPHESYRHIPGERRSTASPIPELRPKTVTPPEPVDWLESSVATNVKRPAKPSRVPPWSAVAVIAILLGIVAFLVTRLL